VTVSEKVFRRGDTPSLDEIRAALAPALEKGGASQAIVFGSYARGAADGYSDLDLIVVASTDRSFFERYRPFFGVRDVWRKSLDMLISTEAELDEMLAEQRPFIEIALEEGVVIYEE